MKKIFTTLVCLFMFFGVFSANTMFAPALTTPTNGAVNQMPNTFLKWSAVPGAFTYKIQVSTDSLFVTSNQYSTNLTAIYSSNLSFNSKYFWRVKAISISDSSAWSAARNFYTINTVTITQPVDFSVNRPVSCYFKWNAISGIANYEYQMDTSLTFSSPLFVSNLISATKTDAYSKQLAFGEHYYLRMRALHSQGTSNWSSLVNFTTLTDFMLRRPSSDTNKVMVVTKLEWDWAGSTHYTYTIATDSLFTTNVVSHLIDTTKVIKNAYDTLVRVHTDTLRFGQKYFWKVRAENALSTSNQTAVWKFTTIDKMTLLTPTNGSIGVTTIPTFKWDTLRQSIGHYVLELDTNLLFSNPHIYVLSNDTNFYSIVAPLLPHTKYYWRMKATTLLDATNWSDVFNFTTTSPIGIENFENNDVSIYPNPTVTGEINIQISSSELNDVSVRIINMVGQEIFNQNYGIKIGSNTINLDLNKNTNGIYFIQLKQGDTIITRKIIVNK